MKVKIKNTTSEGTKIYINQTGELILNYPSIAIRFDSTGRCLNTSKVKNIKIETQNTVYELEVI